MPQGIIDKPLTRGKYGCVHSQRDVTSNIYCDLATQPALLRSISDTLKPVIFRATHSIERKTT